MSARRRAAVALAVVLAGCAGEPPRRPGHPPHEPPGPVAPGALSGPEAPAGRPSDAEILALPDATPRAEPRARFGNPAFYEIFGQRYTVLPSARGYLERGIASWYGPDFHGERTSVGEPYDMYSMTAAHKTLPLPAYARVTNLRNGRSVVVRINDRGPFKANRIIDLSYAAALKLDVVRDGTAPVEVRVLDADDGAAAAAPPAPPRPTAMVAQVGAFAVEANAARLQGRLAGLGVERVYVRAGRAGGRALYRVRVGPIDSVADYDALVARLHALGIDAVSLAGN